MTPDIRIRTKTDRMADLLCKGRYQVPWHQRKYDWDADDQVYNFLTDIEETSKDNQACHFLGTIMLVEKPSSSGKVWEINDGQQRLFTFSLICASLRRIFSEHGDSVNEHHTLRLLFEIGEFDERSPSGVKDLLPRLIPSKQDKMHYDGLIRGENFGTNGKLTLAWREINKFFLDMPKEKVSQFFEFMTGRLEIACLYIPRDMDSNFIFETLNARSKPLSDIDLIRNHIYSFFNESTGEIRNTVHENLEKTSEMLRASMEKYTRCFSQCRFGFLPEKRFYRAVKLKIAEASENKLDSEEGHDYLLGFVKALSHNVRIGNFRAITPPLRNEEFINAFLSVTKKTQKRRNLKHFLHEMRDYSITRPIFFALLNLYAFAPDQRKREWGNFVHICAEKLTAFVMRIAMTGKFEPSKLEKEFANCAQQLTTLDTREKPDKTLFFNALQEWGAKTDIVDNKNFIDKISIIDIRSNKKAQNILFPIEQYKNNNQSLGRAFTIEHILPKSESYWPGWSEFNLSDHKRYVHRLGNLTLLPKSTPNEKDNKSYERKLEILKESRLWLNDEIHKQYHDRWSPENIDRRQKKLAKYAAEIWKIGLTTTE